MYHRLCVILEVDSSVKLKINTQTNKNKIKKSWPYISELQFRNLQKAWKHSSFNSYLDIRRRRAVSFKPECFYIDIMHLIRQFGGRVMVQRLVAALLLRRSAFDPRPVFVGFVMDRVVLGQAFVRIIEFFPVIIIFQML